MNEKLGKATENKVQERRGLSGEKEALNKIQQNLDKGFFLYIVYDLYPDI